MYLLGRCYEKGQGVKKQAGKALELYLRAADKNYTEAMFSLGEYYSGGGLFQRDNKKAEQWFRKAAELGHTGAAEKLKKAGTRRKK